LLIACDGVCATPMRKAELVALSARKLGVIDQASIEFGSGFNVITGETGAGKTLLIGALELCLGIEGVSRSVLHSETKVTALLDVDGNEILLARENNSGRLRAFIDSMASSAELLRTTASDYLEIHGQHDSLVLKNRSEILKLVDDYGNIDSTNLQSLKKQVQDLRHQMNDIGVDPASRDKEIDLLQYQIEEIESAKIKSESELNDSIEHLVEITTVKENLENVLRVSSQMNSDDGLFDQLARAISQIPEVGRFELIKNRFDQLLDEFRTLSSELDGLVDVDALNDAEAARLELRVDQLKNLSSKYGGSLERTLGILAESQNRLSQLVSNSTTLDEIQQRIVLLESEIKEEEKKLLNKRITICKKLSEEITQVLPRVALTNAQLNFTANGNDGSSVEIIFKPNPGAAEGSISDVASGGELSRLLLAISLVCHQSGKIAVFDEIDAGVGGQVAQTIGDCLRELGATQQVIAITHLASVAAKADRHFVVVKEIDDDRTITKIHEVSGADREIEIARMLAGLDTTAESIALAKSLLSSS
jgi:DNA repair protein RecN (Recombination protein N)